MRMSEKTALITGSSSGIGKAVALVFAQESASHIVINYPQPDEQSQAENGVSEIK